MRIVGQLLRGFGPAGGGGSPPLLAVADNADGTGATATISLAGVGAAIEVFAQAVDDEFGVGTAESVGTRTGNGTVLLNIDPGPYWIYAVAGGVDVSNLVYVFVTTGTDSTQQRILEAVQATIRGLSLDGIDSANVLIRAKAWDRHITKPACILSTTAERMPLDNPTNLRDEIDYGVVVTFTKATNDDVTTTRNQLFEWRRRAVRAFRNQRLTGVPEVFRCLIEPLPVIHHEALALGLDLGGFVLRCLALETRGL